MVAIGDLRLVRVEAVLMTEVSRGGRVTRAETEDGVIHV